MVCRGQFLTLLQITGSSDGWSYSQRNISLCPSFAAYSYFLVMIYPAQVVWPLYSVSYSLPRPFSKDALKRAHMRDNFLRDSSVCSYDMQIWPLSSAPCLSQLSVHPRTDPSTRPHIQELDIQGTYRLNFWYYYFHFWAFAL